MALDKVARHCQEAAYPRTFALRVTLAMLYALSDGTRAPYDAFWRECAAPNRIADRNTSRIMRANAVCAAYHQICRTLGVQEMIDFCSDIHAAA